MPQAGCLPAPPNNTQQGDDKQNARDDTVVQQPWNQRPIRIRTEIDREKYALKILRGDFQSIAADPEQLRRNPASDVLGAVSS